MIRPITGLLTAALAMIAAAAPAARAQVSTGRIDVTIHDDSGARLAGVAVEVTGPDTKTQIADAAGQAHFVNLPVGAYTVRLTRAGFTPHTRRSVLVESGSSTAVDVRMTAAGAAETVDVVALAPVVDVR